MKKEQEFKSNGFLEFLWNKPNDDSKISVWKRLRSDFGVLGINTTSLSAEEELLIKSCCPDALGVLGFGIFDEYKRKLTKDCKTIACEKNETVSCKVKNMPHTKRGKILVN
jgi:hypothetical protein